MEKIKVRPQATAMSAASPVTLPRPASFWTVLIATVIKNLRVIRRYLPNLVGLIVQMFVRVGFFLILSGFMVFEGTSNLAGEQLFTFILAGLVLMVFNSTALYTPLNSVTQDLMNGTLEYLYTNPISRYAYYAGTVVASAIMDLIVFVPLFLFLVWYAGTDLTSALSILAACLVVMVTLMAFGTMIALLGLLWRQVNSIVGVISLLFEFLAGAYFPVSEFPMPLKYAAWALPYTWGYDLVRYYSLGQGWKTLLPYQTEWVILIAQAAGFSIVTMVLLQLVERRAKKQGLHLL